jgi:general secretion pathway protein C
LANPWLQGVLTLGVWALVAWSAVSWGLRWWPQAPAPEVGAPAVRAQDAADVAAMARALGAFSVVRQAEPASSSAASRFVLVGVVADATHQGTALIAVDNQAVRPVRVGAEVAPGVLLQSVNARQAVLAQDRQGPAVQTLTLRKALGREGAAADPGPGVLPSPVLPR